MKKRTIKERKKAFKEAYRNELAKQGIVDTPKAKEPKTAIKKTSKEVK